MTIGLGRIRIPQTRGESALCWFLTLPAGFPSAQLRPHVAALLGRDLADYRPAQMTYDLRRLPRKGFIARQAGSTRYELTFYGRRRKPA